MAIVLDSTLTLAWALEEPTGRVLSGSDQDAVLEMLIEEEAFVPALWSIEVANGLWLAERTGRLHRPRTHRFLELLGGLPIRTDFGEPRVAFLQVLPLARERGLTAYEAVYLELAMRLGLPLATHSHRLVDAAVEAGVGVA